MRCIREIWVYIRSRAIWVWNISSLHLQILDVFQKIWLQDLLWSTEGSTSSLCPCIYFCLFYFIHLFQRFCLETKQWSLTLSTRGLWAIPLNSAGHPTCSWLEVWVSLCSRKSIGSTWLEEYVEHEHTAVSTYVWRSNLIWLLLVTLFMVPCTRLRNAQCSIHYRHHLPFTPRPGLSVGSVLRSHCPCCICSKKCCKWVVAVPRACASCSQQATIAGVF